MNSFSTAWRISLGLASLALSMACFLQSFGFLPDGASLLLDGRKSLCEAVAIYCSSAAARDDHDMLRDSTRALVARNKDIESAVVRLANGRVIAMSGDVAQSTEKSLGTEPNPAAAQVPIFINGRRWGNIEILFREHGLLKELLIFNDPTIRFLVLLTSGIFLTNLLYLTVIFRRRAPAGGGRIPERVRATLDTLVEGVLLVDIENRIAMANASFAKTLGTTAKELEGRSAQDLHWSGAESHRSPEVFPWDLAASHVSPEMGRLVGLETEKGGVRTFSVNSTPIIDDVGACRGVLATFDDMTRVERKNLQLRKLLEKLRASRAEIRRQNQKLTDLATRDPLTSCLNRRAFFERFDAIWKTVERHEQALSCVMLDIDHFKSVNDRFGHAVGDQAIQMVASVLKSMARAGDLVCRYGGEEFCVLLPLADEAEAVTAAERYRTTIESSVFAGISVTSSFGVASLVMGATDPHDLLNRADQALYAAKKTGRNRVIRYDQIPPEVVEDPRNSEASHGVGAQKSDAASAESPSREVPAERDIPVPYHAVASLISALAHRDPYTAEHSRRVATLCVITAKGLLSERDVYVLEIAALLHDIGKLGIPDAILKKPGALTDIEWKVMRAHDGMGVEIITAAFSSDELREIVRTHHAWFAGNPRDPDLPLGNDISVSSRILAIADSYDAIVTDRVYRKGRSRDEAFVELQRCAGVQFDPALVDRFIEAVLARDDRRSETSSGPLSKNDALRIGLLLESLAEALDAKDLPALQTIATRLKVTAAACHEETMAAIASRLESAITEKTDWIDVLELSSDLLDLCRSTQATYLATYVEEDDGGIDIDPLPINMPKLGAPRPEPIRI